MLSWISIPHKSDLIIVASVWFCHVLVTVSTVEAITWLAWTPTPGYFISISDVQRTWPDSVDECAAYGDYVIPQNNIQVRNQADDSSSERVKNRRVKGQDLKGTYFDNHIRNIVRLGKFMFIYKMPSEKHDATSKLRAWFFVIIEYKRT
jgi:hypothetical protein